MKTISAWIVALAIIAATGTAVPVSVKLQRAAAEEPCVGLGCWPPSPPVRHRPAHRANLPPAW
jgi:hypothetical protein